jgi:hypothetical protein
MIKFLLKLKILLKKKAFKNEVNLLKECDILFFCQDNDRGLSIDKKAFSPLLDSVFIEMSNEGFICQSISLPWSTMGFNETYVNSLNLNNRYLFFLIINKIRIFFGFAERNYYRNLLKIVNPIAVIGIGLPQNLCKACKELKIIDVELLHGLGYTYLPWGWSKLDSLDLPSVVLSLDKTSTNTFKVMASSGVEVLEVQHPFHKLYLDGKFTSIQGWDYEVDNSYKKQILVTLQWGYAGEDKDFIGIVSNGIFYEEVKNLIKKRVDFCWHFRLHPVQVRGGSKAALSFMNDLTRDNSNVFWERATEAPLFSVVSACDAHITLSSMSTYEIAALGKPSLILCPQMRQHEKYANYFHDLVGDGYAKKTDFDINFIEKWIDSVSLLPPRSLGDGKDNSWDTFIKRIKDLKFLQIK